MHEMALCESILQVLESEAQRQAFQRVKHIWLEVGPFSGAEPEAMKFCFSAVCRGTLAEDATFEIVTTRGLATCMDCSSQVEIGERYDPCPKCGSRLLHVTGGEELKIRELEVD
jgi:hydrogenase nickel incorporation protein HypA/HybF